MAASSKYVQSVSKARMASGSGLFLPLCARLWKLNSWLPATKAA
jgi:hypothetical protein